MEKEQHSAGPVDANVSGWQPIETAPNGADGYAWMTLAWGPDDDKSTGDGLRCGERFFAMGTFYCLGQEKRYELREIEVNPTHWMVRPECPGADQEITEVYRLRKALEARIMELEQTESVTVFSQRKMIEKLRAVPMKYRRMAFNAELQAENEKLRAENAALVLQNKQMRKALLRWKYLDSSYQWRCGYCGKLFEDGHQAACVLALPDLSTTLQQHDNEVIGQIAQWIAPQRNDIPATGEDFASTIRAMKK